jgi:NAD(P)H-flavin reductase
MRIAMAQPEPPSGPMVPELCRVVAVRRETPDVVTLTLEPHDVDGPWRQEPPVPGQFAMVGAIGVGEVPISYSGLPGTDRPGPGPIEHTIRAVGAVTEALAAMPVGGFVTSRGPFGVGWDLDAAAGSDLVVVAGGIGLAPLKPVVEAVLAAPERYGAVHVLVGARTPADAPFAPALGEWAHHGAHVERTVDRLEGPGAAAWDGHVGVVTTLVPRLELDPASTVALVCGPEVMMRSAVRALVDEGMAPDDVQVSLERSMACGIGHCGHCQLGPVLICRDGPVCRAPKLTELVAVRGR